ncbi:MAG: hypothetical protein EBT03_09900 [Betaproteobacteria bacterium]|nr:hypothetical protein [Betaproteobacteria bacterium]
MDPKEFYNRKAQQLSTLCDLLSEVQELTLQMMASERKAVDPDEELIEQVRFLNRKSTEFEEYLADQYMAVAPMT